MQIQFGIKNLTRAAAALGIGLAACVGLMGGGQVQAGVPAAVPVAQASKIDPQVLKETADGKSASVMVLLTEQADVSAAHAMKDQDARGWYVYNTLKAHAEKTQADLRAYLSGRGITHRSFWAANVVEVSGDRALIDALAARSDVKEINSNRPTRWIETPEVSKYGVNEVPALPQAIEWGVQNVNAPQVWAMGYTGQGIVVAGLDTGIRWTHMAIKNQYRGWDGTTANHNYNWWDAIHSGGGICGPNTQAPCDDVFHGTHTVGTAVGDDGGTNQIGVAPGARWIGCRNMNVGDGTPATYIECFQFMIAPTDLTGSNPNPALRPHVLINSWTCPVSEGCSTGDELRVTVENTQAAGIFVQVSAGNAGPNCSSVNDPPAIYEASFSTGAYNISNTLASFSSRGPVTRDGSNRIKPNISAPGVSVRSATYTNDTAYSTASGTSMAGPHVSGVIALLWSARPALVRDIAGTKNVLQNTANPNITLSPQTCGGIPNTQIPNNSFGYGRVDALAAVNSVSGGTPTPSATPCVISTRDVGIVDFAFNPQVITIPAGSTVRWTNNGQAPHTSTSTGNWDSGTLNTGQQYSRVFNTPGTFQYFCSIHPSMTGTVTVTGGCPTSTPVLPTATRTNTPQATATTNPCNLQNYTVATGSATIVPGTVNTGSACDDCVTSITLPFSYQLYDQTFTAAGADSNGKLHFPTGASVFSNTCLPGAGMTYTIFPFWDDLRTDGTGCTGGCGIFTSVTGSSPNRIFNIEWRTTYFSGTGTANFEVRLYEGQTRFDIILGTITTSTGGTGGVQRSSAGFTEIFCNTTPANTLYTFTLPACGTPTTGPSATRTSTAVATVTAAATATCVPGGPRVFTGSITETDPIKNSVNGATSICGSTTPCPGQLVGLFNYDVYPITNSSGSAVCVTITLSDEQCIYSEVYSGAVDPNNSCTNYVADSNLGDTYQVTIPANTTYNLVVEEFNEQNGCANYTVTVTGLPGGSCPTPGATNTTVPATATRTNTVGVPPTNTAVVPTATNTVRPTNTPVTCNIQFTDVPPGATFYDEIRCLACRDIIDGYACGGVNPETGQAEPCNAQNWAYFRPNNRVIRGQIAKIVSNSSADFSAPGPQIYADVPTSQTFFAFINRLTNRGVMGGYPCGGPGEPCNAQNQPYFRPYNYATRGQIAQIVARGANITDPVPAGTQSFTDVPINSTFYLPVERLRARGVMTGFPCGGVNPQTGAPEPCDAQNRAYFRVNNNATRGQTAQIVSRTFFPGCITPGAIEGPSNPRLGVNR